MNVVNNYSELSISQLQQTRLYVQGRPLIKLWRRQRKNIPTKLPSFVSLIDQELDDDYVAIDCAGWYFNQPNRRCTAVELSTLARTHWINTHFEYDYLTWHPTYLQEPTVLAYYSSYFKYSTMDDMIKFFNVWAPHHKKLIVGLDPTKVKFNYLKYNFLSQLTPRLDFNHQITILEQSNFNLLFTIKQL